MKKILLFALFAVTFLMVSCDSDPEVSKAFLKYSHREGVTTITVPGWLISIAAQFGDLDKPERELLNSIDKVKVLAVENNNLNARIDLHNEFYSQIRGNNKFEELLTVRAEDDNVTIFGAMEDNIIEEMLVLVGGDDNALIYVRGEISPELINDQMDLSHPGKFMSFDF